MAKKPDHHPKVAGEYSVKNEHPDFIKDANGVIAGFGKRDYYLAQIPSRLAKDTIIQHHYSGRVVNNSYIHLGIYLEGDFVGVLQFGYALQPKKVGKICDDCDSIDYLELNRMWLDDIAPRNSESMAISYAIKYIKKVCPRVRWIQSFADERCGGLGVVYQAANFGYYGSHMGTFYMVDGETYHEMLLTTNKRGGGRGRFLRANIERATKHSLRQFRYIYIVKKGWEKKIKLLKQPYPKRDICNGVAPTVTKN